MSSVGSSKNSRPRWSTRAHSRDRLGRWRRRRWDRSAAPRRPSAARSAGHRRDVPGRARPALLYLKQRKPWRCALRAPRTPPRGARCCAGRRNAPPAPRARRAVDDAGGQRAHHVDVAAASRPRRPGARAARRSASPATSAQRRLEPGERLPAVAAVAVLEHDAPEACARARGGRARPRRSAPRERAARPKTSSMPSVSPSPTRPSSVSTSTSVRGVWSMMYIALT